MNFYVTVRRVDSRIDRKNRCVFFVNISFLKHWYINLCLINWHLSLPTENTVCVYRFHIIVQIIINSLLYKIVVLVHGRHPKGASSLRSQRKRESTLRLLQLCFIYQLCSEKHKCFAFLWNVGNRHTLRIATQKFASIQNCYKKLDWIFTYKIV